MPFYSFFYTKFFRFFTYPNNFPTFRTLRLQYSIIDGNSDSRFLLRENRINLAQSLNYKSKKRYTLTLSVSDGELSSTSKLNIKVLDANTHKPVFSSHDINFRIKEQLQAGTVIGKVTATDRDTGDNAKIQYAILNENDRQNPSKMLVNQKLSSSPFMIDPISGEIKTTRVLDYEQNDQIFTFQVVASDHGQPVKNDTTSITVQVIDINDKRPVFTETKYTTQIFEHSRPEKSSILVVKAIDQDSDINARITYSILEEPDKNVPFEINRLTGSISLKIGIDPRVSLDREKKAQYRFTVRATDSGERPMAGTAIVVIKIKDINDSPPKFVGVVKNLKTNREQIVMYIAENSEIGKPCARIRAVDADVGENAEITYHFINNFQSGSPKSPNFVNTAEPFKLNSKTGQLSPISKLDYEKQKSYKFDIEARSDYLVTRMELVVQCLRKFWSDCLNLVIFEVLLSTIFG